MIISSIISYQVQDNYELPEQTLLRKKQNEKAINANNRVCDHEVPAIHTPMHNNITYHHNTYAISLES